MIISNQTTSVFQNKADNDFNEEVKEFLRSNIPEQVENIPDPELLVIIQQRREACHILNIETKRGIIGYVGIGFLLGEDFYEKPEFTDLFDRDDVLPDDAIDYFYRETEKRID